MGLFFISLVCHIVRSPQKTFGTGKGHYSGKGEKFSSGSPSSVESWRETGGWLDNRAYELLVTSPPFSLPLSPRAVERSPLAFHLFKVSRILEHKRKTEPSCSPLLEIYDEHINAIKHKTQVNSFYAELNYSLVTMHIVHWGWCILVTGYEVKSG